MLTLAAQQKAFLNLNYFDLKQKRTRRFAITIQLLCYTRKCSRKRLTCLYLNVLTINDSCFRCNWDKNKFKFLKGAWKLVKCRSLFVSFDYAGRSTWKNFYTFKQGLVLSQKTRYLLMGEICCCCKGFSAKRH